MVADIITSDQDFHVSNVPYQEQKNHTPIPTSEIRNATIVRLPELRAHQLLCFPVTNKVQPSHSPCFVIQTVSCYIATTGGEHAARK